MTDGAARGLLIINTGDGKGKTSGALGVLARAWGHDMRARMFQFLKHTGAYFGEHRAAQRLGLRIEAMGDGFTWRSKDLENTAEIAREQWRRAREAILAGEEDVIILDEATYPVTFGWIDVQDVVDTLRRRPAHLHVLITGRNAAPELVEIADAVTEMAVVKHPFREQGIKAQPGLEF